MNEVKDDTETLLRWQSVGGGALLFNARAKRTRTSESPTFTKKIAKICNKKLPRFSWICSTLGKFRNRTFGSSLLNFLAIRISLRGNELLCNSCFRKLNTYANPLDFSPRRLRLCWFSNTRNFKQNKNHHKGGFVLQ